MLLYAKTDDEVYPQHKYKMSGNDIEVRTLDLSVEFSQIKKQLDDIANIYLDAETEHDFLGKTLTQHIMLEIY